MVIVIAWCVSEVWDKKEREVQPFGGYSGRLSAKSRVPRLSNNQNSGVKLQTHLANDLTSDGKGVVYHGIDGDYGVPAPKMY